MNDERETRLEKLLGYLKSDPDNITLLFDACDLALETGGQGHARALLVKLLERHPDHAGASYRMAQLGWPWSRPCAENGTRRRP